MVFHNETFIIIIISSSSSSNFQLLLLEIETNVQCLGWVANVALTRKRELCVCVLQTTRIQAAKCWSESIY